MSTDLIESAYKHCPGRITMAQITVPTSGPGGESGSVGKKPDYPAEEAKAARRSKSTDLGIENTESQRYGDIHTVSPGRGSPILLVTSNKPWTRLDLITRQNQLEAKREKIEADVFRCINDLMADILKLSALPLLNKQNRLAKRNRGWRAIFQKSKLGKEPRLQEVDPVELKNASESRRRIVERIVEQLVQGREARISSLHKEIGELKKRIREMDAEVVRDD